MKIDQDYLKGLLEACQASEEPTFDITDLKRAGFPYSDKQFEFHMSILNDQGFVEDDRGRRGFGMMKGADGGVSWSVLPLRLTASGHEFIAALSNKDVWHTIKTSFKDVSLTTLKDVALKLAEG